MRYIAVVDLKEGKGIECHHLIAKNLVEAMLEAKQFWNRDVHSIHIADRMGRIERRDGYKISKFREIICYFGRGWNLCDNEHAATWIATKALNIT